MSGHRTVYELDESKYPSSTLVLCVRTPQKCATSGLRLYPNKYRCRVLVAPPLLVMSKRTCRRNRVFRKQPLAVSTGSATVLVVPRPPSLAGWGEDEDGKPGVIVQSKPPKQA